MVIWQEAAIVNDWLMQVTTHTGIFEAKQIFLKLHMEFRCQILLVIFKFLARKSINLYIICKMKFCVILDPQAFLLLTAVGWFSHACSLYWYSYTCTLSPTRAQICVCFQQHRYNGTAFSSIVFTYAYVRDICFTDVFHNSFKQCPYWHWNTEELNLLMWKRESLCYQERRFKCHEVGVAFKYG